MAKNTVNAIFNEKKNQYNDFPKINGIEYFDLERRHMHYGKIDFNGDAIYLDDANLSTVFSGTKETHFACNFVAQAFNDMRLNIMKGTNSNLINSSGIFSTKLRVKKSQTYGDLPFSYNVHLNKIYTDFVNNYLSIDRRSEQIKNYKDFVSYFLSYCANNAKYFPVTRTGFITSIHCSPFVSGLMLEVANESHGVGTNTRILKYTSDDFGNFDFFSRETKKFGFLIDRNAPWRFVFNIASGMESKRLNENDIRGGQIYLSRFGVTYENVFSFYFKKAHLDELLNLKNQLQSLYTSFYEQFPTYEILRYNKSATIRCPKLMIDNERAERSLPSNIGMTADQHERFLLKVLLKLRFIETGFPHNIHELQSYIKEMLSYNRLFGTKAALNYINDLTKGFAVINFNIRGDHWYGKPQEEFELIQQEALDNAANPALANVSLTGTKSIK